MSGNRHPSLTLPHALVSLLLATPFPTRDKAPWTCSEVNVGLGSISSAADPKWTQAQQRRRMAATPFLEHLLCVGHCIKHSLLNGAVRAPLSPLECKQHEDRDLCLFFVQLKELSIPRAGPGT